MEKKAGDSVVRENQKQTEEKSKLKKKWYERIPVHPFDAQDENLK